MVMGAALATTPGVAWAVEDCPSATLPRTLVSGRGVLESTVVDARGRLLFTDTGARALMRLDAPGSAPVAVAQGVRSPGGLALEPSGTVLLGEGDGFVDGLLGNVAPGSRLLRVDTDLRTSSVYASGLAMANGIVRGSDGTVYGSDDVGLGIDRVPPGGGPVQPRWASVISPNGLALSPDGGTLYAAQTFQPAAIVSIDVAHPDRLATFARPPLTDVAAGLDGLAADAGGTLYVAANGAGEVWRVDRGGAICALARGLLLPSAVAVGRAGGPFAADSLFVVTFSGSVLELAHAVRAPLVRGSQVRRRPARRPAG